MTEVLIPNGFGSSTAHWEQTEVSRGVSVTMGYSNTTGAAPIVAAAAIWALWTHAASAAAPANMLTSWSFTGVNVLQRNTSGDLESAVFDDVVTGTLSVAGGAQPPYSPLVVSKQTALAGKRQRGRMYPPMTLSDETGVNAGGSINSVLLVGIRGVYDELEEEWLASDYPPYLLHSESGLAPTPITNLFVRPVVGSQRRRKNRGS